MGRSDFLPSLPAFFFVGDKSNRVTDYFGTVGGGWQNRAGNDSGSLDDAIYATVGGGDSNTASGHRTTVGGGASNTASGNSATVVGGNNNTASGPYSFAAGRRSKANHQGTFVWGDSTDADFFSSANDQFLISAAGGVGIGLNNPSSPLTVNGVIESKAGGIKFPDGTTQTTAAASGNYIQNSTTQQASSNFNISGNGIIAGSVGIGTPAPAGPLHMLVSTANNSLSTMPRISGGSDNLSLVLANTATGGVNWFFDTTGGSAYGQGKLAIGNGLVHPNVPMMMLQADGNVGIGTNTPGAKLHVNSGNLSVTGGNTGIGTGANSFGSLNIRGNSNAELGQPVINGDIVLQSSGTFGGAIGVADPAAGTQYMWIQPRYTDSATYRPLALNPNGGNVGIGTNAPTNLLTVNGRASFGGVSATPASEPIEVLGTLAGVAYNDRATGATDRWVTYATGGTFRFWKNALDKVTIDGNGNLCAANIACASDARLNTQIKGLSYGLSHLMQLRPVSWQWKDTTNNQLPLGLIAQEVETVIPELVLRGSDQANTLGLNYMGLVPIVVKAIQEQQTTIQQQTQAAQALKAENEALKQQNAKLETRLAALEQMMQQLTTAPAGKQPKQQ